MPEQDTEDLPAELLKALRASLDGGLFRSIGESLDDSKTLWPLFLAKTPVSRDRLLTVPTRLSMRYYPYEEAPLVAFRLDIADDPGSIDEIVKHDRYSIVLTPGSTFWAESLCDPLMEDDRAFLLALAGSPVYFCEFYDLQTVHQSTKRYPNPQELRNRVREVLQIVAALPTRQWDFEKAMARYRQEHPQ